RHLRPLPAGAADAGSRAQGAETTDDRALHGGRDGTGFRQRPLRPTSRQRADPRSQPRLRLRGHRRRGAAERRATTAALRPRLMRNGERQTDRLFLRRPSHDDRALYHAHFTHPAIERWLRPPPLPPFNSGAIDELVAGDETHWSDHGFGPWVLIDLETGAFAGRGGLHWTTIQDRAMIELAWSIEPSLHNS